MYIVLEGEVALRAPKALFQVVAMNQTHGMSDLYLNKELEEVEWLGVGDYFGEAALLSGGRTALGVDAVFSSAGGGRLLMLPAEVSDLVFVSTFISQDNFIYPSLYISHICIQTKSAQLHIQ